MTDHITRRVAMTTIPAIAFNPAAFGGARDDIGEPLLVFLVRHAEKRSEGDDPGLTEAGTQRAERLASMLRDANLTAVHSTPYNRTRHTAGPVAESFGLEVQTYDPRHAIGMVRELQKQGGRHLIVGHSNTTPALVEGLGGNRGEPIDEATEYDRLYIVTVPPASDVITILLRY